MRIGIVLTNPPQKSETFLISFINVLSEKHEIILFTTKKAIVLGNLTQYIYLTKSSGVKDIFINIVKLFRDLKKFNILKSDNNWKLLIHDIPIWTCRDLDYLHFSFGNLAVKRENYAEVMGCKMSVSFRGSDINIFPIWHKINYYSLLNKCDRIHCNSQLLKNNVLKHNKNVISKIHVINPGIQNEFVLSEEAVNKLIDKRKKSSTIQIISIGRLHWVKGYEIVLEALAELKKSNDNFKYLIIGSGIEEEKLVYLTSFYSLEENVIFLGSLGSKDIRAYLEASHLFIQTSWAEGFSNSTMEAQALGLPVIVTPVSGMDELIEHKVTGFIANSHNSNEVYKGLEWYLSLSIDEKVIIGQKSVQRVHSDFSRQMLQKNWVSFFSTL